MNNMVFFGTDGLTSTSANHIANIAKEYIQNYEKELKNTSFVTTKIMLLGSQPVETSIGISKERLNNVSDVLDEITEAKSLIAWLREAIKAKEALIANIQAYDMITFCKEIKHIEYPKRPDFPDYLTEEEYYDSLSIKERNHYYSLETEAAVIGKYIHPEGAFSKAREELFDCINNPNTVKEDGRDTIIYSHISSVSIEDVNDKFFELQKKYRAAQAELNGIKHACELAIEDDKTAKTLEYEKQLQEYNKQLDTIRPEYEKWKNNKLAEIAALKIIIPDSLGVIYTTIRLL